MPEILEDRLHVCLASTDLPDIFNVTYRLSAKKEPYLIRGYDRTSETHFNGILGEVKDTGLPVHVDFEITEEPETGAYAERWRNFIYIYRGLRDYNVSLLDTVFVIVSQSDTPDKVIISYSGEKQDNDPYDALEVPRGDYQRILQDEIFNLEKPVKVKLDESLENPSEIPMCIFILEELAALSASLSQTRQMRL